jgi:polysaccharide export outer membrane protein
MFKTDENYPVSTFEPTKFEYVLKPYDRISVRVTSNLGESYFPPGEGGSTASYQRNLQGFEFPVEFDGTIKVPIIGRVSVSGKTLRETEEFLEEKYSEYFVNPFVLVKVTNRKVTVFMNSGTKATIINMPSENLTLIEAIAQAGGLTNISKAYKIKLIRGNITDSPEIYYWNISTLEDLNGSNCILEANDIIYVESKPQYVSRVLTEISPYLTLTTTLVAIYGLFFK